jgi:hypothetical protein
MVSLRLFNHMNLLKILLQLTVPLVLLQYEELLMHLQLSDSEFIFIGTLSVGLLVAGLGMQPYRIVSH